MGSSLIGIIIVWMFCYFMAEVNVLCMSDKWVKSRDAYSEQLKQEQEEAFKKQKDKDTGNKTKKESESTKKVSYDVEKNVVNILEV